MAQNMFKVNTGEWIGTIPFDDHVSRTFNAVFLPPSATWPAHRHEKSLYGLRQLEIELGIMLRTISSHEVALGCHWDAPKLLDRLCKIWNSIEWKLDQKSPSQWWIVQPTMKNEDWNVFPSELNPLDRRHTSFKDMYGKSKKSLPKTFFIPLMHFGKFVCRHFVSIYHRSLNDSRNRKREWIPNNESDFRFGFAIDDVWHKLWWWIKNSFQIASSNCFPIQ